MRSSVALFILASVLAIGLVQILRLRVQSNDVLPDYSSLLTAPSGLTVLFDSLEATGAVNVTRNNRPPERIPGGNATLVFAGVDLFNSLNQDSTTSDMEALASKGNRVVLALSRGPSRFEKVRTVWDVRLIEAPRRKTDDDDDEPARWPCYFQPTREWHTLYQQQEHAVIIEKQFDSGSIVLLASTWPLTNEAMVQDRQSDLLAALFSEKPRVIFDESHLGLEESGTVMALGRRFHLEGFLAGLLLLACLFVWRNLAGFPPDRSSPVRRSGRDSLTGLSILLARNVPEDQLIETCVKQSGKPLSATSGTTVERFEAMRRQLAGKKKYL